MRSHRRALSVGEHVLAQYYRDRIERGIVCGEVTPWRVTHV